MGDKRVLRDKMRQRRDALTPQQLIERSAKVTAQIQQAPFILEAESVALYASIGSEVQTAGLFDILSARGVRVGFPRIPSGEDTLAFAFVSSLGELTPGAHNVPEPGSEAVPLTNFDVVIAPGLAFDRNGGRLGYGAGWYDRTLSRYQGTIVGLAYDLQVVDSVPMTSEDKPMDYIATENLLLHSDRGDLG